MTPNSCCSPKVMFLPLANKVWGKVMYLHVSVILFTGGSTWAGIPPSQYTPWAGTPQAGTSPLGRYAPKAGTPPGRYPPGQVHPLGQVHPQAGTPPWAGTPPLGRYTPGNACWDTVNKRVGRILLECILVFSVCTYTVNEVSCVKYVSQELLERFRFKDSRTKRYKCPELCSQIVAVNFEFYLQQHTFNS